MWNRNLAVAGLAFAAVAVVGACTDNPPTQPQAIEPDGDVSLIFASPAGAQGLNSLDATFAQIAQAIPGFGGLFYDDAGNLNVQIAKSEGVRQMTASELARVLTSRMRAEGLHVTDGAQRLVVHQGEYDFRQLHAWHQDIAPVLAMPGVVYTDADETTNRLQIGVERGASVAVIEQALQQIGVPLEAVTISETEPIVPLQIGNVGSLPTLRDRIRPVAGGLQLIMPGPTPTSVFICTLGFNARAPTITREQVFFTNSHCTDVQGGVEDTPFYQQPLALPAPANLIGIEVFDPPYFTGPPCPMGLRCRFSDAAVAHYVIPRDQVAFARIMQPLPGSIVLPSATSHFRITEEADSRPVIGQALAKVGRSSGMTGGPVTATCVNVLQAGTDIGLFCQELVLIAAIGGDSGSPVIEPLEGDRIRLHGLVWGGSSNVFVYSSILNIRAEIPGPWIVH